MGAYPVCGKIGGFVLHRFFNRCRDTWLSYLFRQHGGYSYYSCSKKGRLGLYSYIDVCEQFCNIPVRYESDGSFAMDILDFWKIF